MGVTFHSNHVRHESDIALKKMLQERGDREFMSKPQIENGNLKVSNFKNHQVCKAIISTVMGRSPEIMNVYRDYSNEIFLSYKRNDGVTWRYKCVFDSNLVSWMRVDGDRIQTEIDVKEINGKLLVTQTHSDGSKTQQVFAGSSL
ncbi:hypothetical protein KZY41_004317 [Vibrio vulnificus]|nr:hypothetical protein [Vibrio vulnificus]